MFLCSQLVDIPRNETVTNKVFEGNIIDLPVGKYFATLSYIDDYYLTDIGELLPFELVDKTSSDEDVVGDVVSTSLKNGILSVRLPSGISNVSVYGANGRILFHKRVQNNRFLDIPMNNYGIGVFFIQVIHDKNKKFVDKVVVTQ